MRGLIAPPCGESWQGHGVFLKSENEKPHKALVNDDVGGLHFTALLQLSHFNPETCII